MSVRAPPSLNFLRFSNSRHALILSVFPVYVCVSTSFQLPLRHWCYLVAGHRSRCWCIYRFSSFIEYEKVPSLARSLHFLLESQTYFLRFWFVDYVFVTVLGLDPFFLLLMLCVPPKVRGLIEVCMIFADASDLLSHPAAWSSLEVTQSCSTTNVVGMSSRK